VLNLNGESTHTRLSWVLEKRLIVDIAFSK
jgi:hypothetical protein